MNYKKILINLLLLLILISLIFIGIFVYKKYDEQKKREEADNIELTEIGYGSKVSPIGYTNASGILGAFINAYNESNGEQLVSIMNLVGTYIYSEFGEENFDSKYEEILSKPDEFKDLIIMQYSLQKEEAGIIEGVKSDSVTLSLIENEEINDVSKYLSKMTAKIRTVSEAEGIDKVDELEFILLHRDKAYYIMNYLPVTEK